MIYFNHSFYKQKNDDLNNLENNELENHYYNNGYSEFRTICEISSKFNKIFYKEFYKDLNKLNDDELWNHYIYYGIYEKRIINYNDYSYKIGKIYSIDEPDLLYYKSINADLSSIPLNNLYKHFKENCFNEKRIFNKALAEFDYEFYKEYYEDLKILENLNNDELWKHYLYYGSIEKRYINSNFDIIKVDYTKLLKYNINPISTGIIYVYYNRPEEYKNETNLKFFIYKTIETRDIIKDNLEFLFIINNYFVEVTIPEHKLINVLENKNCLDFDAYLTGMDYFTNKYKKRIDDIFDNILFINCSITGPFSKDIFWLDPFYNKMNNSNIGAVTTLFTSLKTYRGMNLHPIQIPGYIFLIRSNLIYLLIKPNNILNSKHYSNTVFGTKLSKMDCIISGEHCISTILIKNKINIASLVDKNIDYVKNKNYNLIKFNSDRHPNFDYDLYEILFIKNHWRSNNGRDCHPVKFGITKQNLYNELNIENNIYNNYNYSLLNIPDKGLLGIHGEHGWNSKEEFYNIFGESEEFIIYPISSEENIINYYHFDSYIKKYTYEAFRCLLFLNYKINFYTNIETSNLNLPSSINVNKLNLQLHYELNKNLGTHLLFPTENINIFKTELKDFLMNKVSIDTLTSIIKKENYKKIINNSYLNYLSLYL